MAGGSEPTAFVTGAAGFIGLELVRLLVARGHNVLGLTPSHDAAQRVRQAGATAVVGDLLVPGRWQDEAAADWVFHVPPQSPCRRGSPWAGLRAFARARGLMDAHLLDAVAAGATRRIVYVADACGYGVTGPRPITEDEPLEPTKEGRALAPTLERVEGYALAGLPIVMAIPGCVYGHGGWYDRRIINSVMTGRRVLLTGKQGPWTSVIHVHDCARALLHLTERGEVARRYFLVNDEPVRLYDLAATFALLVNRPLRAWHVPAAIRRLAVGPLLAEYLAGDRVFSNSRLRGSGFRFRYPTLDEGLRQIVEALRQYEVVKECL